MLIFKKTRYTALLFQIAFHSMNQISFNIGTFPAMMLASSVLWLDSEVCVNIAQLLKLRKRTDSKEEEEKDYGTTGKQKWDWRATLMLSMITVQLFLPLRAYTLTDNPNWTNESHYFSWRMMLNEEVKKI